MYYLELKLHVRNCVVKFGIDFTIQILEYTNFSYCSGYRLLQRNLHVKLIIFAFNSVILNVNFTWILYLKIMNKHLYNMFGKIIHI